MAKNNHKSHLLLQLIQKLEVERLNKSCTDLSRWEGQGPGLECEWGCKERMNVRNTQKVKCTGSGD